MTLAQPPAVPFALHLAAVGLFGFALWRAPWRSWLKDHPDRQHVWGLSLLVTAIIWTLRFDAAPGLSLQLLIVATMTLMHGWALALVANGLVIGASLWLLPSQFLGGWSTHFLCDVALPAAFITLLNQALSRRLPRHFAIYFLCTVFFGSIVAFVLSGAAKIALLALADQLPSAQVLGDYEVLLGMMGFAQGTINGMVMAGAVIYHPEWVRSFDEAVYFGP